MRKPAGQDLGDQTKELAIGGDAHRGLRNRKRDQLGIGDLSPGPGRGIANSSANT